MKLKAYILIILCLSLLFFTACGTLQDSSSDSFVSASDSALFTAPKNDNISTTINSLISHSKFIEGELVAIDIKGDYVEITVKDKEDALYKFLSVFYSNNFDPNTSPYGDLSLSYNIWEETGTNVKVYYDGTASYDTPQKAFVKSVTNADSEEQLHKELAVCTDKLNLMANPVIKTHKDVLDATLQYLQSSLMQDTHFESLTDYSKMEWIENLDNPSRSHYTNENFMLYVAEFSADCYDYKDDSDEMEFVVYLKQIPDTQGEYQESVFKFWVLMNSGKVSYNGKYINSVKP